jgi:hypothetical protein
VWSLRELPEPLRPVGTLLALDAIWTRVTHPADRRPRLVVVDEAWLLLQQPAGAQFLLRQAPQAIDAVVDTFGLSEGERAFLLAADRGHALLSAGVHRVGFCAVAADAEHDLITTDPAELAARDNDDIVDAAAQRQRHSPTAGRGEAVVDVRPVDVGLA